MADVTKTLKTKLKALVPAVFNHPTSIYNGVLIFLSGALEQLWEEVGFKCPSSLDSSYISSRSYQAYSLLNVFGPAFALWMLCLLGSNMAWRLCQGCKHRFGPHECDCLNCCTVTSKTLVVPLAWIFVALMDGDFYACYFYVPNCPEESVGMFIDGINCTTNITLWNHASKVKSQSIGWGVMMVILLGIFIAVFCDRCRSKETYFRNLFSTNLRKMERAEIKNLLEAEAQKRATANAETIAMKVDTLRENPRDWEKISRDHPGKVIDGKQANEHYSAVEEYLAELKEREEAAA